MSKRCVDCEHFRALDGHQPTANTGVVSGHCRAHPPQIFPLVDAGAVMWRTKYPETTADSAGCGEFSRSYEAEQRLQEGYLTREYEDEPRILELGPLSPEIVELITALAATEMKEIGTDDPTETWEKLNSLTCQAMDIVRNQGVTG